VVIPIEITSLHDTEALLRLEHQCFTTDRLKPHQFRHFIRSPTACVFAVKQNILITAAAIVLFRKSSRLARLYSMAVDPCYRKQGIAQALLEAMQAPVIKRACTEMRLEVRSDNTAALAFYKKNGYSVFGEYPGFYEDGAPALRMSKRL